jgi:2-polyprenyl-6-methoxyphenol hydroxylase-like FAD-dependent oxidoreductase
MATKENESRKHTVVIGGSIAGLLAARVLSAHFKRVTLVERDTFPDRPAYRNGVPQSRHLHVLLLKGKAILECYFPGLEAELIAEGAVPADLGSEFRTVTIFGRVAPAPLGLKMLLCSRHLIEFAVRRRLNERENVRYLTKAEATGLLASEDNRQVVGLRLRPRAGAIVPETLAADLVVDCSGRGSAAADWLADLGYPRPETTVVNSHLGYATRWYKQPAQTPPWKGILVTVRPPHNPRGGGLFSTEGGLWVVTLGATAGLSTPNNESDFLTFASQLSDPAIYDAIHQAEPVSQIYGYRRTENQWRHYERLGRWPGGLVVMGDAACCFNPVYGQGMTAAALAARSLDRLLDAERGSITSSFGRTFQGQLAKSLGLPWLMATREDFRWDNTEGVRPGDAARLVQWYFDRVIKLARRDPHASRAFNKVVHLLQPPASLFHPRILLPALAKKQADWES